LRQLPRRLSHASIAFAIFIGAGPRISRIAVHAPTPDPSGDRGQPEHREHHEHVERLRKLSAGNRDRAIQHYVRTYELNAQNYAAHNNLANLYLEWGKRERSNNKTISENGLRMAIRECEATLAINPQYHLGYDNLANTYYELGQMDKAAENYKNALRYKPDYPEGMNDLGALCLDLAYQGRNIPEALHNHQEALAVLPKTELLRKKKLCAFFGQRWLANVAGKPESQIDAVLRQKLKTDQCTCVAEMQSEAAPARSAM